jgi:chromosome segregation ATPase
MPKLTDTYARAYDCCDAVFTELGRFPTIDLIRERIGVNSPVTIKKAMNEWTRHFAERHFDQLNRPDVPVALAHAMEQAWKLAVLEAEKAYQVKEQGYVQNLAENRVAMEGLEQEKAFLKQMLGEARGQIADGEQHIQALRQQLDTQAQALAQSAGQLAEAEKNLVGLQGLMQDQSQRWQQQQEQEQAWFARRISEEKQFVEEKFQDKLQRQGQQIALLTESEASLRQTCTGLKQELRRLEAALAECRQKSVQPYKFKVKDKANKKSGKRPGG